MKKNLLLFIAISIALTGMAQGNSQGKGNGKKKDKKSYEKNGKDKKGQDDDDVWNGAASSTGKLSKNQPAKVREAFSRDYPNAGNVVWSKYRGDWTATFNSGLGRSTAIYHANGERRDTRTRITRQQLPNGTVWDDIFKRDRVFPNGNIVQVQSPSLAFEIFRVASQEASSKLQYLFYNSSGKRVQYNY